LDLADKIAVVTGTGRGIGLAVATAFVDEGAHVLAASPSTETLDGPTNVNPVASDLSLPDATAALRHRWRPDQDNLGAQAMSEKQLTSAIQRGGLRWSRVPPPS
jgi:NAD(P)-dependent dehydrogenase (short-subunit alcohol dehydrogenase family)